MAYTARYPDRVSRLVIVDIGPVLDLAGARRIVRQTATTPDEFESFEAALEYTRKQNRYTSDPVLTRRVRYAIKELPDGKVVWRYDPEIRRQRASERPPKVDPWPMLQRITCPTLIVRGTESDLLSPSIVDRMLKTIPDSRLVEIERAGHMVFEDNPEEFLAALRDFLRE